MRQESCKNCKNNHISVFKPSFDPKGKTEFRLIYETETTHYYQCLSCATCWVLYDFDEFNAYALGEQNINDSIDWESLKSKLSNEVLDILSKIGPTSFRNKRSYYDLLEFPCSIEYSNNNSNDFSLIRFQKLSPYLKEFSFIQEIKLTDQVLNAKPSRYALSKEIRNKTAEALEVRMSFAPTAVKDHNGNQYILNWVNNFFKHDNIVGSDLSLVKKNEEKHESEMTLFDNSSLAVQHVFAKWDDDFIKNLSEE